MENDVYNTHISNHQYNITCNTDIKIEFENDFKYLIENIEDSVDKIVELNSKNFLLSPKKKFERHSIEKLLESFKATPELKKQTDPLDLVQKQELKIIPNVNSTASDSKPRLYEKSKLQLMKTKEIKLISSKLSQYYASKSLSPCFLTVTAHMILIGLTDGKLEIFAHTGDWIKEIDGKKQYGNPVCGHVSLNEKYAVLGYEIGSIIIWNLEKGSLIKSINVNSLYVITSIKFWQDSYHNILSGDINGNFVVFEYKKSPLSTSLNTYKVLNGEIGPIVNIDVQVIDKKVNKKENSISVIAVTGVSKIFLYAFELQTQEVFVIEKDEQIPNSSYPCVVWKPNQIQSEYFLIVGWGNQICLYRYINRIEWFELTYFFKIDIQIIHLAYLNANLIFLVGENLKTYLLKIYKIEKNSSNCKNFLKEIILNSSPKSQNYLKIGGVDLPLYHNTVSKHMEKIFVLENFSVVKGFLIDWKDCIEELCNKKEWLNVLALAKDFSKGKYKKMYNLPDSNIEIYKILENMIKKYISTRSIELKNRIYKSIEFCIDTLSVDFIYVDLYEFFMTENSLETSIHFIKSLETFILKGKLKSIPSLIMGKFLEYYSNDLPRLEHILMHLNPLEINPSIFLLICEQNYFVSCYIYISTNSSLLNFITPLDLLMKFMLAETDQKKKFEYFYKIFWYSKLCLEGKKYPQGEIPSNILKKTLADVMKWILDKTNLEDFINMDVSTTLNVIKKIFDQEDLLNIIKTDLNDVGSELGILNLLLSLSDPGSFVYHQTCIFSIVVASRNNIQFPKNDLLSIITQVLQHKDFSIGKSVSGYNISDYITNLLLTKPNQVVFGNYATEDLDIVVSCLLRKHQDIILDEISNLYKLVQFSAYTEVLVYLLEIKKEYKNCLNFYVKSQTYTNQVRVFAWIQRIFRQVEESEKNPLKKIIINLLPVLANISPSKTLEVVNLCLDDYILEAAETLDDYPGIQVNLLSQVSDLKGKVLVKYIELLCLFNTNTLYEYLFNLDNSLLQDIITQCTEICLKYNCIQASLYLLEKQKKIQEGLDLLLNQALATKDKILSLSSTDQPSVELYTENLFSDFDAAIKLLKRNLFEFTVQEAEKNFLMIIYKLISCYEELSSIVEYNLESKVQDVLSSVLISAGNHIQLETIILQIFERFSNVPLKFFKGIIASVFFSKEVLKCNIYRTIRLTEKDNRLTMKKIYTQNLRGVKSSNDCSYCGLGLQSIINKRQPSLVFLCGHSFHKKCLKGNFCIQCISQTSKRKTTMMQFIEK